MCDCWSYNAQTGSTPNVVLDPKEYIDRDFITKNVCLDACIAEEIKMLWKNDIWTGGCCCGHNGLFNTVYPQVIIDESENPKKAIKLLKQHDPDRKWYILQWQEVDGKDTLMNITNNTKYN